MKIAAYFAVVCKLVMAYMLHAYKLSSAIVPKIVDAYRIAYNLVLHVLHVVQSMVPKVVSAYNFALNVFQGMVAACLQHARAVIWPAIVSYWYGINWAYVLVAVSAASSLLLIGLFAWCLFTAVCRFFRPRGRRTFTPTAVRPGETLLQTVERVGRCNMAATIKTLHPDDAAILLSGMMISNRHLSADFALELLMANGLREQLLMALAHTIARQERDL